MATANLSLDRIQSSDYVSPETIDGNFQKLDVLGVDYITESGTKGEWWYRRWKKGRLECGIDFKNFGRQSFHTDPNLGNFYETVDLTFGAYPFAFAKRPFCHVQWEGDSTTSWRGAYAVTRHTDSLTMSPSFFVVDWIDEEMDLYAGILVSGYYK